MNDIELVQLAVKASLQAGEAILKVYETAISVEMKEDNSPLTEADKQADKIIGEYLKETSIPILSEEGKHTDFAERKKWKKLWIVDPLDGTKEFIKRNGEFTVNIALVEDNYPVIGVIYVPVTKTLYVASKETGAVKIKDCALEDTWEEMLNKAEKLPLEIDKSTYFIVASRSHLSEETSDYIKEVEEKIDQKVDIVAMGSSLKICLVAEGRADAYPRFAPTMEWDTAAGQAIAEAAGASFIHYKTGKRMRYNRENLRNDWFLVKR